MDNKKTQLRTDSKKSEPSLPNVSAANLKKAEFLTRKLISAYPDYNKAPPEYLLTITELVSSYSLPIQYKICDARYGVPSKTSYLPTAKDIVDFAAPYVETEWQDAEKAKRDAEWEADRPRREAEWKRREESDQKIIKRLEVKRLQSINEFNSDRDAWRKQRGLN